MHVIILIKLRILLLSPLTYSIMLEMNWQSSRVKSTRWLQWEHRLWSSFCFTKTRCNTRVLKSFNPEKSIGSTRRQFCRCRYVKESLLDKRIRENMYGKIESVVFHSLPISRYIPICPINTTRTRCSFSCVIIDLNLHKLELCAKNTILPLIVDLHLTGVKKITFFVIFLLNPTK